MNESKKKDRYEDAKKFVRYSDGAKMYSMGMTKFQEVAKDAKACYKIGQLVLVNTEILDKYLEKATVLSYGVGDYTFVDDIINNILDFSEFTGKKISKLLTDIVS